MMLAIQSQQQEHHEQEIEQQPEHLYYNFIENYFIKCIQSGNEFLYNSTLFDNELERVHEKFHIPYSSLISWIRNLHLYHTKRNAYKLKNTIMISKYIKQYIHNSMHICQIANSINYSPYLVAKCIIQEMTILNKKNITDAMKECPLHTFNTINIIRTQYQHHLNHETNQNLNNKNHTTTMIDQPDTLLLLDDPYDSSQHHTTETTTTTTTTTITTRFAKEIQETINIDPMYGPIHDKQRHMIGIEYEVILEYKLQQLGIPFETETQLRERGTSRTPDILLSIPVGIQIPTAKSTSLINRSEVLKNQHHMSNNPNDEVSDTEWKMIHWIDSKALFGDVRTHKGTVMQQAESYVHRFGPGLIIYWFGHAPFGDLITNTSTGQNSSSLSSSIHDEIHIIGWDLPTHWMLPTGEIIIKQQSS